MVVELANGFFVAFAAADVDFEAVPGGSQSRGGMACRLSGMIVFGSAVKGLSLP